MDYLEIVIQGYLNNNTREHLQKYFFREYKKAEKEHFDVQEFFSGCLNVIQGWEDNLQNKVFEREAELYLILNEAENGTLLYADLEGETIEKKRKEIIERCEQELKDVRPDGIGSVSFTVNLFSLTNGRIAYNITYDEVLKIKLAIYKALPPKQAEEKSEGLTINQIAIIHVYNSNRITRENGDEIAKQYNHNSGEKLFQKFTYFSSTANRKGKPTPCTPKKLKNKIELFESIIPHLTDKAKKRANEEIQILKTFESEY